MKDIDTRISRVIKRDACSGCGACTLLDDGLRMRLNAEGYLRPERECAPSKPVSDPRRFDKICPGVRVNPPRTPEAEVHPLFGPYIEVWQAWASDPAIRLQGSSGGTLTALTSWLLATRQVFRVTGAAAGADPRQTVPVTITTRDQAMKAAGSRYAPVGAAGNANALVPSGAVIGKPCEVSAVRALASPDAAERDPLMLSFFCAGTPSAHATTALIEQLGLPARTVPDELWYRGRGWPGEFTVRVSGRTRSRSYEESWGSVLGPTSQWRCKMCVDGTGEHADIVAADSWLTDEHGYPIFDDRAGVSALIARTPRGQQAVRAAIAVGVLIAVPVGIDHLTAIQPLQVERRRNLLARMVGSLLAGRRPPSYAGYTWRLLRLLITRPRMGLRVARGTWRRVRAVSQL